MSLPASRSSFTITLRASANPCPSMAACSTAAELLMRNPGSVLIRVYPAASSHIRQVR
ncbi:hypothetical protein D3C85_1839160 [compost metagenome]